MRMERIVIRSSKPAAAMFAAASFNAGSHGSTPTTDTAGHT
jgi:hypothetical protein